MKKFFFLLMAMTTIVACQKEFVADVIAPTQEVGVGSEAYSTTRSYEEALSIAEEALSHITTRSTTRAVKSYEYYVAKPATRSQADTIEVAFHLINYENNGGYALVPADNRTTDVYMYSDVGQISVDDFENKAGLSIFKEAAIEYYQAEVRGEMPLTIPSNTPLIPIEKPDILNLPLEYYDGNYYFCKTETFQISQEPMIHCYWNQGYPYNTINGVAFCPYTGCGINSIGQIMSYHKYPQSYGTSVYDWDLMTANSTHSTENAATNMIAQLMYDIGDYLNVDYEIDHTSTTSEQSRQALLEFGYTAGNFRSFSTSEVINELDAERPIWIRGEDINGGGHAWAIDAYRGKRIRKTYYETTAPYLICFSTTSYQVEFRSVWGYLNLDYSYTIPFDFRGQNYDVSIMKDIKPNN